jgi:hypothetical protein
MHIPANHPVNPANAVKRELERKPPKTLQAVGPRKTISVKDAVEGTERELLTTLRTRIGAEIDAGPAPHALAQLVRQLREIDKEIRSLDERAAQEGPQHRGRAVNGNGDEAWTPDVI